MNDAKQRSSDLSEDRPHLSVIIPAYNEESRIEKTLSDYLPFLAENYSETFEILVVDDGSTDSTFHRLQEIQKRINALTVIRLPHNCGKGEAVKVGMKRSQGRYVLMADADGSTPIEELKRLMNALTSAKAEIAIGSRALTSSDTTINARWYRRLLGRTFNAVVNFLLIPNIQDTQCGFKLYSFEAAQQLAQLQTISHYGFDLEHLYIARKSGFRVVEVPINWIHREGSKVNLLRDGLRMLVSIPSIRFRHRSI